MCRALLVVIIQVITLIPAFSQEDERYFEFGRISREEIMMKSYDLDTTASAVVLFDYGESLWTISQSYFRRHTRIKIFKKDGYDLANMLIALGKRVSHPTKFKAATYNLVNGKLETTKLTEEGFFKEDFNEYIDVIRFTMPNVREGSIIEVSYELPVGGLNDWQFQREVPIIWSEYKTTTTNHVEYHKLLKGYLRPHIRKEEVIYCGQDQCRFERFVMKDVPAFANETFIPAKANYAAEVIFEIALIHQAYFGRESYYGWKINILSTWDDLVNRYFEDQFFDNNVIKAGFLKKTALEIVKDIQIPDDKVMAIHDYVKKNMDWNNRYRHKAYDIKKAIESKTGSSAEINLMLLAMLRYAGLPADPVLISTRENGFVRQEVPNSHQFNNVVVLTDLKGGKFLLDATEKNLSYDFLPESCLNGYGYVAIREKAGWVKLENLKKSRVSVDCNFAIAGANLIGEMKIQKSGYDAEATRRAILNDGENKYTEAFFSTQNVGVKKPTFVNLSEENAPLVENHSVEMNGYLDVGQDVLYLNPIVLNRIEENPFKAETRNYPVDFKYPKETVYSSKFKIPEGYRVDELPSSKMSLLPDNNGKFIYNVTSDGKTITVIFQLVINKSLFSLEEYPSVREFFRIVTDKTNEQIVLKSIK